MNLRFFANSQSETYNSFYGSLELFFLPKFRTIFETDCHFILYETRYVSNRFSFLSSQIVFKTFPKTYWKTAKNMIFIANFALVHTY